MKEMILLFLCGLLLAVSARPQLGVCKRNSSEGSRLGCKFPVDGDTFESSTNQTLAQRNNTEENSSLNETAEVLKTNETVAEQTTQPLKIRGKRQQEASDDVRDRHPFSSGGSTFASTSDVEQTEEKLLNETETEMLKANETKTEEKRLNETETEMLKANETMAEQTTQPLKIRAKRQQEASDDVRDRHPFSSGGSTFASTSDVETEEKQLNETETEMLKANETMVEQTTQPPKPTARAETQKPPSVHLSIRHPFSSGGSSFASKSQDEAEQATQPPKIRAKRQPGTDLTIGHPFRSGGSFASKSADKVEEKQLNATDTLKGNETTVEEKQLNETETEMLKGNETMTNQMTPLPTTSVAEL